MFHNKNASFSPFYFLPFFTLFFPFFPWKTSLTNGALQASCLSGCLIAQQTITSQATYYVVLLVQTCKCMSIQHKIIQSPFFPFFFLSIFCFPCHAGFRFRCSGHVFELLPVLSKIHNFKITFIIIFLPTHFFRLGRILCIF